MSDATAVLTYGTNMCNPHRQFAADLCRAVVILGKVLI